MLLQSPQNYIVYSNVPTFLKSKKIALKAKIIPENLKQNKPALSQCTFKSKRYTNNKLKKKLNQKATQLAKRHKTLYSD